MRFDQTSGARRPDPFCFIERVFDCRGAIKEVGISYEPHNDVARKLYASLGFMEPGEIVDEEVLAVLKIRP